MEYTPKGPFVNVPYPDNPPAGAKPVKAEFFNDVEDALVEQGELNPTFATNEYVGTLAYGTNLEATDATTGSWVEDPATITGTKLRQIFTTQANAAATYVPKALPRVFVDAYAGTDSERLAAACAAATASGGLVELPPRIVNVGSGFSMSGYSCGIVGRGARYNTGDGANLSVIRANTQTGPALDFTGFNWPAAYRGVFEFGDFVVEGNNIADPTKANIGIQLGVAPGPGSVVWRNIAVTRTGGPCLAGESVYLHEFENVRLVGPVSAAANDVPWVDFRNASGCQFDFVLYAAGTGANVGAAGAVRFGSITNFGSANNHIKLRPENLQLSEGATILHLEGNGNQIQADLFDCHRVTGTTTASVVRLAKPPNDFGGNRVIGTIYGDNNNASTGFSPGVDVLQSGNSIAGVKGYHGGNVRLASGVVRTYAALGGAEANAAGAAFIDNSGNSENTLLDYVVYPGTGTPEGLMMVATKPVDTIRSASNIPTTDPHLVINNIPPGTYALDGLLVYNSAATVDLRLAFTHPGTGPVTFDGLATAATAVDGQVNRGVHGTLTALGGAAVDVTAVPRGLLTVSASSTAAIRWGQEVADPSNTILRAGSWVRLTRVA